MVGQHAPPLLKYAFPFQETLPGGEVRWWTEEGEHRQRPAHELSELLALARFAQVVRNGAAPAPSLAEMARALGWVRQARG